MTSYSDRILEYCNLVIIDGLPNRKSCLFEKQAAQRHLDDLKRQNDPDYPYYFSEAAANRRCAFTEYLQHTKGKWRGEYIRLEGHQLFIQGVMFGWLKKSNNKRRFNKAYIEIPRKNGKSIEVATSGLYMCFADGEPGAEVYSGAQTEAQALMTFEPAFAMVRQNQQLADYYELKLTGTPRNPTSIYRESDMSRFLPIVGKPGDGASPHAALVDEFHEAQTSVLYDAMDTGMGAREQPLLIVVTTAGVNIAGPCYELHLEAVKILERSIEKETTFVMMFGLDKEDKWEDWENWIKVNPNYGVSINEDYLKGKYNDALTNLTQRNILLTKHLNLWQNVGCNAFDMLKWTANARPELKLEDFKGKPCVIGVDLANRIDIVALEIMFELDSLEYNKCPRCGSDVVYEKEQYLCYKNKHEEGCSWQRKSTKRIVVFSKFYLPESTVHKRENQHYQTWVNEGLLTATEGDRTDFQKVEEDLEELSCNHIIKELVFDPKEASYLIQNIQKWANFECVEFGQSPVNMSEPMKETEAMIMDGCFLHDGNKILTWMFGNVVKKQGKSGGTLKYYYPTKEVEGNKIDGAVAAIMALARIMTYEDDTGVYDKRVASGEETILRVI